MAEEKETGTTETKKKGGKMIILIIAVLVLLGGAGGGFYFWRSSVSAETAKKKEKKAPAVAEAKSKNDDGQNDEDVKKVVELQPFIVNLADTEQARYLRMSVSLGVGGDGAASEKPDQVFTTRVRNAMLAVLTNKKSEEVLSPEGKTKLRRELLQAAQAASDEPEVKAVYITDFIVQL